MLNCAIQALYHNDLHRWRSQMVGVVKVLIEALSGPALRFLHQFMWVVMETMCCCRYDCKNVDWIVIGALSLGFCVKEIWSAEIQFEQFVHRILLHCQGLEYCRLQVILNIHWIFFLFWAVWFNTKGLWRLCFILKLFASWVSEKKFFWNSSNSVHKLNARMNQY